MSSSVHSIQAAHNQAQAAQSVQPPKTLQTDATKQTTVPKDTVSISQQARQSLASNTRRAGDVNHDGNT
jgi:hypothetical protein